MNDLEKNNLQKDCDRRDFIRKGLKLAGVATLLTGTTIDALASPRDYTVQEVIDLILREIPGAPFKETVDTLKSGTGSERVTGIVTTMFATVEVIRKAASMHANFIIAHEPTFYNHTDDMKWTGENSVVSQKEALLKEKNIAVWRFHDYWHAYKPDGIIYGVLKKINWVQYAKDGQKTFTIPAMSLKDIAEHLKTSLGIQRVRVIGDLASICKKVSLLPGAWGGQNQITTTANDKPDVVIVGEVHEWETAEYIRDARALGVETSLIVLGHSVSEEPGMEWLVDWLQPKLDGIRVTHVPSGNPFSFV